MQTGTVPVARDRLGREGDAGTEDLGDAAVPKTLKLARKSLFRRPKGAKGSRRSGVTGPRRFRNHYGKRV